MEKSIVDVVDAIDVIDIASSESRGAGEGLDAENNGLRGERGVTGDVTSG